MTDFEKYLFEQYGELANDLIAIGVDNEFKLKSIEKMEEDLISDDVIKLGYINYGEKFAYPEVDINKWNMASAHLDKLKRANYSEKEHYNILGKFFKDRQEYDSFLSWSRQNMENKKRYMHRKEARYGTGIVPETRYNVGTLPGGSFGQYSSINELYSDIPKNPSSVDEGTMMVNRAKEIKEELKNKKNKTKASANRYLKGLSTLLQSSDDIPWDVYSQAVEHLFELMKIFRKSFGDSIQASAAHRTANAFDDLGLQKYASDIRKFAQELEQPEAQATAPTPQAEGQTAPATAQPQEAPEKAKEEDFRIPESEPVDIRTIKTPGPSEGDYNKFMTDDVTVDDATMKLDAVASMLADRRVIRMLAEFDIMLDKLGIASMFPELAESQSKLIDAFSYALTRVSKMMGQLSNAKELIQAARNLPGEEQKGPEKPEAETPEANKEPDLGTEGA